MSAVPIGRREPLAPVRCASWCAEGTGHAHQGHPEDQFCYSLMPEMTASLHQDDSEPMAVYARKEAGEDVAYVVLRTPDDREVRLTAAEVTELAELLRHMAWVSMQDGRVRNAFELGQDAGRLLSD